MKIKLTKRQRQVLAFVKEFGRENQCPPTRIEIAEHFGFASPNAAQDHLKALSQKGALILLARRARGIYVTGLV